MRRYAQSNLRTVLGIAKKDLTIEFRRLYEVLSILAFSLGSVLICSIAWRAGVTFGSETISAALWIILFFASILTFTTSFTREMDRGTIAGLKSLPCSAFTILLGKTLYSIVILFIIQLTLLPSAVIFLNLKVPLTNLLWLIALFLISAINLSLAGSYISALVMFSEGKNLLLSFLLFPISIPTLIPSITATEKIAGHSTPEISSELRLLLAFLLFLLFVAILTFEQVLKE